MDRKVVLGMTVVVVMFLIAAAIITMNGTQNEKERNYANELSENGGWISTTHHYVYVNSDYHVEKGTEVYQDELGIWVHTTQDGKSVYHLFQWSEIKSIMIGDGQ